MSYDEGLHVQLLLNLRGEIIVNHNLNLNFHCLALFINLKYLKKLVMHLIWLCYSNGSTDVEILPLNGALAMSATSNFWFTGCHLPNFIEFFHMSENYYKFNKVYIHVHWHRIFTVVIYLPQKSFLKALRDVNLWLYISKILTNAKNIRRSLDMILMSLL